jgi:DNA-binding MarR family transcriptional regulator
LTTSDDLERLLWETRRLFQALAAKADEALKPLGLTGADRALIEFLSREAKPISVAALARKRNISRQHIHQTLARLRKPNWVERLPDPNHARSVLLTLSDDGREAWKQIRVIDRRILKRLGARVDPQAVRKAADTLHHLREQLSAKVLND